MTFPLTIIDGTTNRLSPFESSRELEEKLHDFVTDHYR